MKLIQTLFIILSVSILSGEIIEETGSLKEFLSGTQEGIAYDVKNPMDEVGLQTQIVVKRYGRNYVFTGKGKTFDEVIKSFEFIDPVLEGAEQDSSS